jgi:hypothetical protein
MIRRTKDGRALLFALSALLVPSSALAQGASPPQAHDKVPAAAKKGEDPGDPAKKDPAAKPDPKSDKAADPAAKPDPKSDKPGAKAEGKPEGQPGKPGDKPADPTMPALQKSEPDEAKLKDRLQRRKSQQETEQAKLNLALKGLPMSEAMQQELTRHARRLARLERIKAIAHQAKDDATEQRVTKLIETENARHDKFTANAEGKDDKGGAK